MLKTLQTAARDRYVHLIFLPVDAKWDDYRQDAGFVALLSRCGFSRIGEARNRAMRQSP